MSRSEERAISHMTKDDMRAEIRTLRAQHRAAVEALEAAAQIIEKAHRYGASFGMGPCCCVWCKRTHPALTPASPDTAPVEDAIDLLRQLRPAFVSPTSRIWEDADRKAMALRMIDRLLNGTQPGLDPATCRAQGHGRVACQRCGAEWVGPESVRQGQAVGR